MSRFTYRAIKVLTDTGPSSYGMAPVVRARSVDGAEFEIGPFSSMAAAERFIANLPAGFDPDSGDAQWDGWSPVS